MNLTLTLESEIVILNKYKLSPNELFILRLILIYINEGDGSLLKKYLEIPVENREGLGKSLIKLQEKGIILKSYNIPESGKTIDFSEIPFNKNFLKGLYRESYEIGKELFEHYPQFATIGSNVVPIRGVSKKFDSLEDAYFAYGKAIKWSPDTHRQIIELIDWARDKNIINTTLCNFIIDRKWIDLEAMKNGNTVNINYDAIKMI